MKQRHSRHRLGVCSDALAIFLCIARAWLAPGSGQSIAWKCKELNLVSRQSSDMFRSGFDETIQNYQMNDPVHLKACAPSKAFLSLA